MIIPKKSKKAVYSYLFKEGVMVAKKDLLLPKHGDVDVPNIYVIKLMQSLKSKGYVKENFNWQWFYWFLTNEGIEYLRDYLHLPEEIVPDTLKKPRAPARASGPGGRPERTPGDRPGGDRPGGGRRPDEKKLGAPGADFKPDFRGGMGRGRGGRGEYRSERGGGAPSGRGQQ